MTSSDTRLIRAAQALFVLNAAIWLTFAIASMIRLGGSSGQTTTAAVVAVLMLGNVAAMLLAGWEIGRRSRLLYLFAWAVLAVNILLTFADQFGLFDFLTLIIDLVLATLLITTRRMLWSGTAQESQARR